MAAARTAVEDALRRRAAAVPDRAGYSLVHGELGPDHVRLDQAGRPALVDIEGLMFADPEWEHAFLEHRFREHYRPLRRDGLDQDRLRLYRLALALSLVEGPLRLLDTAVPDRDEWQAIAENNVGRVLTLL